MKKKVIGIAAVIAALALAFFGYSVWSARKASSEAVEAFNEAAQKYNEAIAPYNKAADGIASANDELQKALDQAQADIDSGDEAYEPDTLEKLKEEREKAETLFTEIPVQIDPFDMMSPSNSFSKTELAALQQEAEAAASAVKDAQAKIPATPVVPDYSEALESLLEKRTAYEDSVQKLKNVTCPPDSFIRERLKTISTVVQTGTVTGQYDPNGLLGKKGGYTGCVYFLDARVNRELLPAAAFTEEEKESGREEETAGGSEEDKEEETGDPDSESESDAADTGETAETGDRADTGETAAAADQADTGETAAAAGTGETTAAAEADDPSAGEPAAGESDDSAAGETIAAVVSDAAATGGTAAQIAAEEAPVDEGPIDVVMIGTAGGGAVEIFATKEDAEARIEYLAFFDGSVMEAGSYDIEGTCVIRTSKYLSADEQKDLTKEIRKALLRVPH